LQWNEGIIGSWVLLAASMCDHEEVDVPPPWYTVAGDTCSGETRSCGGGDDVCRTQAERDGYVAISNYSFCRRAEVHSVPTASGVLLIIVCVGVIAAAIVVAKRRSRR
jgi:hypothetical protein